MGRWEGIESESMAGAIERVVILGGGTAGWLAASVIAARHRSLSITLVESPDLAPIGVGEGTWPTMRGTLSAIGIGEAEFLVACDASFKQGSRFDGWVDGTPGDRYYHPFGPPPPGRMDDLLSAWRDAAPDLSFAAAMTPQADVCDRDLAPRQRRMPGFAGALNYAYHLDAGKFAALLARHATHRLGVTRVAGHVNEVVRHPDGDIAALLTREGERLDGDLFIDCSGHAARLIGQEMGADWIDRSAENFNDSALAVQVPVQPGSPIASQTIGTAHEAGWFWDIALPGRRGIGCVYASRFMDDDRAADLLRTHIARAVPGADGAALTPRRLTFATGHRAEFWKRNCLSIGLSAGFIEPLEASAIVLIELSLRMLTENMPASRAAMDIHAGRFNALFRYRWDRIVDFLKLHYVLSRRPEPYWMAQRDPETMSPRLRELLALWRDQPPSAWDFPQVDEVFPAASHQYVLYGMGFPARSSAQAPAGAVKALQDIREQARALCAAMPANRAYLENLAAAKPPSIVESHC